MPSWGTIATVEDSDDERPTLALHVGPPSESDTTVTLADEQQPLAPGSDVGGYIVEGVLGKGGMGVVYAATHPVIGKRAAIKVLRAELSRDLTAVERFVIEARAVNQIGHPNIVDIFAFGMLPDGRSYYVMDLLTGESLRARLKRGPLHISEAASVIDETASALIAAHAKGIIHRDLKPDNVFVVAVPGRWPEVKLLDWGLAKLAPELGGKPRTLAGEVMGTPVYMSPEQARAAGEVDHRTDIYSLGVMSYEILAGVVPFKGQSSIDTLLAHQDDPVPPLQARVPTVPEELAQLIEAMLAKEADQRPTLAAVRAVLKRLRGTKIPTMTAAGLQIAPDDSLPAFPSAQRDAVTMDLSRPTTPRRATTEPQALPEQMQQALASVRTFPLPPPEQPSSPSLPPALMTTTPGYGSPLEPPSVYPQGSQPPHQMAYTPRAPSQPGPPQRAGLSTSWAVIIIAALVATAIGLAVAFAV